MAGLQINAGAVAEARKAGYSDNEIVAHLAKDNPAPFKEAADQGYNATEVLNHLAPTPKGTLEGLGDAVMQGGSNLVSGVGETLKQSGIAPTVGESLKSGAAKLAPAVPQDNTVISKDGVEAGNVPRAIAEASPSMAAAILAARLGAKVPGGAIAKTIGAVGAGTVAGMGMLFGKNAKDAAEYRTGDAASEPTTADKTRAALTTLPEAAVGALGASRFIPGAGKVAGTGIRGAIESLGQMGSRVGAEAAASGVQDLVAQTGKTVGTDKGLSVDPYQVANNVAVGGATAGLMSAPRAAGDVHGAIKYRDFGGENADASARFANRVATRADGESLKDTKVGRSAVEAATNEIHSELSDAITALKARMPVDVDTSHALDRAKTGTATKSDLDAIDKVSAGDPLQGLAREALVAAKLRKTGTFGPDKFTGGISSKLDKLRPIYNPVSTGASAIAGLYGTMLPGMIGMYAPGALAGVYGTYAAARIMDNLTGARSPAARFVNRFENKNVPMRNAPPAPPVGNNPTPGRVPQIAPLHQPWGSEASPEAPVNLRPGITIDEGMARMASKLGNEKKRSMINEAAPLLRKLSETGKVTDLPDAFASNLGGGEPALDPKQLIAQVTQLATWRKAAAARAAEQERQQGVSQADRIAQGSPLLDEVGGLNAVSNPAMGKRASQLVAAANAVKKLTAQPEEPAPVAGPEAPVDPIPAAIVTARITKKAGKISEKPAQPVEDAGPVRVKAAEQGAPGFKIPDEPAYEPVTDLWRRKLSDDQVASQELSKYSPRIQKLYSKNVVKARETKRSAMESLAETHDADAPAMAELFHQLDHISRRAGAVKAIEHYTKTMTPEGAAAVRAKFNKDFINATWRME